MGYWSATYLLHNGENPYSFELMTGVQRTQAGSSLDVTIMAWNPPVLFVFLLPLAWMSFPVAKFVWLLLSIIMVITAVLMLIQLYIMKESARIKVAFILFSIGFPAVLAGFYMGQVTFLVFWGLVACTWLIKREQWFWAGAVLILTTVKPHLVILPVIYLLIFMMQLRQFQGWTGLTFAGFACLTVLLMFRLNLIFDLFGETSVARVSWATSTIGGLLSYLGITDAGRYIILLFLPLPFFLAKFPERFSLEYSVALLTLVTVPTTFFGWSYDQTILLIPIAQVFGWFAQSKYKVLLITCIVSAIAINYYQRLAFTNDVYYVWIPLFWLLIFFIAQRSITVRKVDYVKSYL